MFWAGWIPSKKGCAAKMPVPINRRTSRALPGRGPCIPGTDGCRASRQIAAPIWRGGHREHTSGATQEGFVERPARTVVS